MALVSASALSNSERIVRAMAAESRDQAERERRERSQAMLDAYYNQHGNALEQAIKKLGFAKPHEKIPVRLGFLKKFADSKGLVFAQPPVFAVTVNGEVNEEQTEAFAELAEDGQWIDHLRMANVLEQVLHTLHIFPRPLDGAIVPTVITPSRSMAWQDEFDPQSAVAFAYMISTQSDTAHVSAIAPERWAYWSAEEHFVFEMDSQGSITKTISAEDNPDNINPLGIIPAVKVDKLLLPDSDYWGAGATDVLDMEYATCIMAMDIVQAINEQGFTITHSTNFDDHLFQDGRGPGSHYNATGVTEGMVAPSFGAVQLSAEITEMVRGLEALIQHAALLHNLPPTEFRVDSGPESGAAKMIARIPLMEERAQDVTRWRRYLRKLFQVTKVVIDHSDIDVSFSEDAELQVDFPEPEIAETPAEQLDRWRAQLDLGLTSKVAIMREINPDLTREAAEERLLQIAQDNQRDRSGRVLASVGLIADAPES